MTKEMQFLWAVQTLLLLYVNHRAETADAADISATAHVSTIQCALAAAPRIPVDMDAGEAARQFHFAFVHKSGEAPDLPGWLVGLMLHGA